MNKKRFLLFTFVLVTCFSIQAAQVTYYVNAATGNDFNDGSQEHPWATLNLAAWATGADDCIINVAPGVYFLDAMTRVEVNAQIIGTSKDEVALVGEGDEDFWDDSRGDLPTTGGAFFVPEGSSLTLKNLTLKNQRRADAWGGSIKAEWGATLNLENVDFLNSIVLAGGGAAIDCDGTLNCKNVLFQGCTGPQNVVSLFTNATRSDDGTVRAKFENTHFIENESLVNGIINMEANLGIDVSFDNCLFEHNKVDGYGAILRFGVYSEGMHVKAHITNSSFIENLGKDACCMAMYTNTNVARTVDLYVANSTFYKNFMTGYHSAVFTVNGTGNNLMTGDMVFVNNSIINNGRLNAVDETTIIAIPDFPVHVVFVNNVIFANAQERSIGVVLWDALNPEGGAWRSTTILGNFIDRVGGTGSQVAPFQDAAINTMIVRRQLNEEGEMEDVNMLESLKIKTPLTYPATGGVPYLELATGSALIDNDLTRNEAMISGKNVVLQTDVRGKAIIGGRKDVGAFEYDPDDDTSIFRPEAFKEDITVFPNPFNEVILLRTKVMKVEIYNVTGMKCISVLNPSTITTSNLPAGVYLVRITALDGNVKSVKMIK